MKTALVLIAIALTSAYIIYQTIGIWGSYWFGVMTGFLVSAYHLWRLWQLSTRTAPALINEATAYAFKLSANYIGTGALLTIPYAVLWHVKMPSLLVYTVWAYFTAVSYVATGYIAAGVLLLTLSFFSYLILYGYHHD